MTPEQGVTRYQHDPTQGPACAIAAGAATIYRNYFAPVGGSHGQTTERQFDGLADLGEALSSALNQPVKALWTMQNGYALCTRAGLHAIAEHLGALQPEQLDILRGNCASGYTATWKSPMPQGSIGPSSLRPFAPLSLSLTAACRLPTGNRSRRLVLEAAYEATMWAAVLNAQRGASNVVLLTLLGGGAFGNDDRWIYAAMRRALKMMLGFDLDVRLVSYGPPSRAMVQMAENLDWGSTLPSGSVTKDKTPCGGRAWCTRDWRGIWPGSTPPGPGYTCFSKVRYEYPSSTNPVSHSLRPLGLTWRQHRPARL